VNLTLFIFDDILKKQNVTSCLRWNSDLLYVIYMLGKRGVTIGIRAGWSVRPSSWVVCVVWRLNTIVVFSYYCSLC